MADAANTAVATSPQELAKAIVQSTLEGIYPESDQVALSELDYSSLPSILSTLREKRNDLTVQTSHTHSNQITIIFASRAALEESKELTH
jgi:uncharacterized protein YaaW (UPF0174 family)